ncbi:MAG: molybdopterin biosynthesis protein [Desulfobacterales bacterium]|jgi:putative molybdopterin biosynthesis protein|nr:molybdopterin biosynthesis protein [Desulfobacteraceae bacterium]MBT7084946.1 molybdopterin biosynthesis protein [Desulfobacterales bacterium]MBT7696498.1 molybdopterin biosynthesis protein [Desulfobacterales bacterium]
MNTKRNVYLKKKTLKEAHEILYANFPGNGVLSSEIVPVADSVGRVLAKSVSARFSSPHFHASAMDGIAVKAEYTYGAGETSPKELVMGVDAFYVNTGHVLPENTDAVIMIENINDVGDSRVEIEAPAFPWQYVRKMGEDIVATELLFSRNHVITPYCIGALISGGVFEVPVLKKPKILIIPTGNELVDWRKDSFKDLKPGQVLESNSYVLGKLAEECGAVYEKQDMVLDDLDTITEAVSTAIEKDCDMVFIIGGSSAGSEDYARPVISSIGDVLVHGVTIMPGKPAIIGKISGKPVFGIPGYPVSAIVAFEQFVRPIILKMLGQTVYERDTATVEPTKKIASKLGVEEFLRVKLGEVGGRIVATPLPRGAGNITSITEADGIIRIPNDIEGIKDNEHVKAELLRPLQSVNNTIVAVGSHDNTLDVLADQIRGGHTGVILSSSHVGSMGGLMAIKKGVCHIAGSHLLDINDGTYNISYVKKHLPDITVKLVNLVLRDQGLIVPKGNPKEIKGIEDLGRDDIFFINRQGGSGTRILLDYRLGQCGIDPGKLMGYDNEEFTHMNVAAAVLSGRADAGLGIFAAAKALDLDFIPVVTEQYDLVIPEIYFETDNIQILLETINKEEFKTRVVALGGYSTDKTGTIT